MTTGLERIAMKSQCDKKLQFTSLTHHITPQLLWSSLNKISTKSSVGVDGVSVTVAKEKFNEWSPEIIEAVHRQGYHAPPVKRVYIPKPGKSEKRPIGFPPFIDRALQGAVSKVLNSIYEQDFLDCSMGGRPNRSAHHAVATLNEAISGRKVSWVYEADLKNFFGSLNHGWVERFLAHRVGDPRIASLIKRWLKAGVMDNNEYQETLEGVPQGGPISVLLSNIYLHYALDLWVEKVVKPALSGEVYYVRYVDDFVLCFQYKHDAIRFQEVLVKRLARFSLSLEPSKTRLIRFGRFAQQGARDNGERLQTLYFLGFTFYCTKNRNGNFKVGIKSEKSRLKRSHQKLKLLMHKFRHYPLKTQQTKINQFLTGHYNYYGICGNHDALKRVYYYAVTFWRKALSTRSQRGNVTWEIYVRVLKYFPIRKPKLRYTYSRFKEMALL